MTGHIDVFDDFHLHGASAPEWNQRYVKVSPGVMRSRLTEFTGRRVHVFRKWLSARRPAGRFEPFARRAGRRT